MDYNIFSIFLFSLLVTSSFSKVTITPNEYLIDIITTEKDYKDQVGTEKLRFNGAVEIIMDVSKTGTDEDFDIGLRTNEESKINNLVLEGVGTVDSDLKPIQGVNHKIKDDWLIVQCPKAALAYKKLKLSINFTNPYGEDMTGFYRSSYKDASGNTKWLLTTHFEPIFARKAFPCFDQPDLKAFFTVKLTVPKTITTVLCNTPVKSKADGKDNVVYTFEQDKTPMSTYLVAFTASELTSTAPVTFKSSFPEEYPQDRILRTYGRDEIIKKGEGKLGQDAGKSALDELTKYLGIGYALKKVDQVGIPDFSAGAMENWGHISFREKALFFNEKTGSTTTKQSNVLTITHELVHQWFGNLVTLESWDYIWLNEAFANYIEYVISAKFTNPDTSKWDLMKQMVVSEIHSKAFETDGLNSSKPLNNKITDEKLIFSSFNDIPYAKGSAVLRMWNYVLKDKFQESLKAYLQDRKGKAANPPHLFESFKKNGMNEKLFKTWTDQAGYPVVEVKKLNKTTYTLTQSRFFWEKIQPGSSLWYIPISFSTDKAPKFAVDQFTFMDKEKLDVTAEGNWIIVNNQQAGYFRVNYDKENWEALSAALGKNSSVFPEVNRAQIVNDIFSLARSLQKTYVDYSTALNLAKYLKNEKSLIVLKTALNAFDFLQTKLYKTTVEAKFKEYLLNIITPHFKTLNSKNLEHTEKLRNIEISRWACALQYEPCVKEAKSFVANSSYGTLPDTQETILCTGIRNDDSLWDKIFQKYQAEEDSSLKIVYLMALGCTTNAKKTQEFLDRSLKPDSGIRKQDLTYVMSAVYNGNLQNVELAFTFLENKYKEIATVYGGMNPLGRAMMGIARKLNSKKDFGRLKVLAEKIKKDPNLKSSEEAVANALQIAESNYIWVNEKEEQFKRYFNKGSVASSSLSLLAASVAFIFRQ